MLAPSLLALAVPSDVGAQSPDEIACRRGLSGALQKHVAAVAKASAVCHKKRSAGRLELSVDCNDPEQSMPAKRLARGRERIVAEAAVCATTSLLPRYARCPSPAEATDDGSASDGIDDFSELGQCLAALAELETAAVIREAAGSPAQPVGRGVAKCQRQSAKLAGKLLRAILAARSSCQQDRDEEALGLDYRCRGSDPRGKAAKAALRLERAVAKSCVPNDIPGIAPAFEVDELAACGETPEHLSACVVSAATSVGNGLSAAAYALPADCRVGGVIRIDHAGVGRTITASSFSGGWRGAGHGIDLTDGFREFIDLDCDADCAVCAVSLDTAAQYPDGNCRCDADPSVRCSVINGADPTSCGVANDQCSCFLGPPAAVAAGGAPACIQIRINDDYAGWFDAGRGAWVENTASLAAVMHLGADLFAPCPRCLGDSFAADDLADGTCEGGARDGLPCDITADHATFGPSSYDCPPSAVTNVSGTGLRLSVDINSSGATLPFALPCDDPTKQCACRVCSGDSRIGCSGDDVCANSGAGLCTGTGGAGVQPNECSDGICGADGHCVTGPVDRFCDGVTYADGRGYISCVTDADCTALGAGSCTIVETRRCFADPISAAGEAGLFGGTIATSGCLGVTNSVAINQATGLPGPVRVVIEHDAELLCTGAGTGVFEPPTGANCTTTTLMATTTTTTTTLPGGSCGASAPACNGSCPAGLSCSLVLSACVCS